MSEEAQKIALRVGYAMFWPILLVFPVALLAGKIEPEVFVAVEVLWVFIALVLIIGPDSIAEVSFGKASIRRYAKAAEADAKEAKEAKEEAVRAREDAKRALEEAEKIREQLREAARVTVENCYILASSVAEKYLPPGSPPANRLSQNMNKIWSFVESDPRVAHYTMQEIRGMFGHPPVPYISRS